MNSACWNQCKIAMKHAHTIRNIIMDRPTVFQNHTNGRVLSCIKLITYMNVFKNIIRFQCRQLNTLTYFFLPWHTINIVNLTVLFTKPFCKGFSTLPRTNYSWFTWTYDAVVIWTLNIHGPKVHHNMTPQELCNNWLYSAHENSISGLQHSTQNTTV